MKKGAAVCVLFLILYCNSPAGAQDKQGPRQPIPELKLLNRWAGDWNKLVTFKAGDNDLRVNGSATGSWMHGGFFLEQRFTLNGNGKLGEVNGSVKMTYDLSRKAYRKWDFDSYGTMAESFGVWDAGKRIMTWTHYAENGVSVVTVVTVLDDDSETWATVIRNQTGNVISESSGKNTRRAR